MAILWRMQVVSMVSNIGRFQYIGNIVSSFEVPNTILKISADIIGTADIDDIDGRYWCYWY